MCLVFGLGVEGGAGRFPRLPRLAGGGPMVGAGSAVRHLPRVRTPADGGLGDTTGGVACGAAEVLSRGSTEAGGSSLYEQKDTQQSLEMNLAL